MTYSSSSSSHSSGILLHYEDPSLSDLYFVDPQWLGSMLSCVVTVQEKNPFQKNGESAAVLWQCLSICLSFCFPGFMEVAALGQVLRNDHFPPSVMQHFIQDFISLMQKFEVVLLLDRERLLIPSLLPPDEESTCVILPCSSDNYRGVDLHTLHDLSRQHYAGISSLAMHIIGRYYLLPYVPNGFFPHLIARIIASKISSCFQLSVPFSHTEQLSVFNNLHWRCWRGGIMLLWRHMEIFRIAPTTLPPQGVDAMFTVSSSGLSEINPGQKAIEIKVACLPEEQVVHSHFLPNDTNKSHSMMLATWLLQQSTEIIDSVFSDWYEAFTGKCGFDINTVEQACPCVQCLKCSLSNQYQLETSVTRRDLSCAEKSNQHVNHFSWKHFYLFSSPYCVLMASRGTSLDCPVHRKVTVDTIAPDLVC